MLTLRQLLDEIELFRQARVVAGKQGLDRAVQWPQIADTPGMTDWLQQDELLLTTAFALQEPGQQQRALVQALAHKGLAGMVVTVGRYFEHVPRTVCRAADELDFPVVELPWQVPLLELGKQISQTIIAEQQELLSKSLSIHQTLTQLVVEGAGLQALARALAHLIDRSVSIEDSDFTLLAYTHRGAVDEARNLSVRRMGSSAAMMQMLKERGVLADLQRSPRPMRLGPIPALGMTLERIVAPIVAGGVILGYVWVLADARSLTQLDFVAIEHAATVAALIITKERDLQRARERRYGDLLDDLLSSDLRITPTLQRKAAEVGLEADETYRIMVLSAPDAASPERGLLLGRLQRAAEAQTRAPLFTDRRGELVLVLREEHLQPVEQVLTMFWEQGMRITAGLGAAHEGIANLPRSYRQAREAATIHGRLDFGKPLLRFEELGLLHWLYHLGEDQYLENRYTLCVRTLADHDVSNKSELLHTLAVYLRCGGNASAAAKALFLHRSTLLYRLEKCARLCDLDLASAEERMNLYAAVLAWQLREGVAGRSGERMMEREGPFATD
ncbi:MAG: PucR family transcriptional regulator [Caldilineae bacterium]|nr:MAG: PucR family transcriptional regulator [Caldilineae bacterium]